MRQLLFSMTKKDFEIFTFSAGGKGGQNQNRRSTGVRIVHRSSGATGEGRDSRHQAVNKQRAFLRCVSSATFKKWHKVEVCRRLGFEAEAEKAVEEAMASRNLKVEVLTEKGWSDDYEVEDAER